MKSLKILLNALFFSIFCIFTQLITAIGFDENKMNASKIEGVKWNFEFKNKEKKAFQLSLKNGDAIILDQYAIPPSKGSDEKDHFYLRLSDLDLTDPTYLTIFYPDKKGTNQMFLIQGIGKTEFLTYENGNLRAQTGTGILNKKTQSGLSLNNNISDKNIEKTSYAKLRLKKPLTLEQKEEAWGKIDLSQLAIKQQNVERALTQLSLIVDQKDREAKKQQLNADLKLIKEIIEAKKFIKASGLE